MQRGLFSRENISANRLDGEISGNAPNVDRSQLDCLLYLQKQISRYTDLCLVCCIPTQNNDAGSCKSLTEEARWLKKSTLSVKSYKSDTVSNSSVTSKKREPIHNDYVVSCPFENCRQESKNFIYCEHCKQKLPEIMNYYLSSLQQSNTIKKVQIQSSQDTKISNDINDYFSYYGEDNLTVGCFDDSQHPIFSTHEFLLFSEELSSLKGTAWIDGKLINCFAKISCSEWGDSSFALAGVSSFIFAYAPNDQNYDWPMYHFNNLRFDKYLFFPILLERYWTLYVVDIKNKKLIHIDSLVRELSIEKLSIRSINAHKNFIRYVSQSRNYAQNFLQNIDWTIGVFNNNRHMQQRGDPDNCGVYLMYYMDRIGKGLPLDDPSFTPKSYRIEIARKLLSHSQDMSTTCLLCFSERNKPEIRCIICQKCAVDRRLGAIIYAKTPDFLVKIIVWNYLLAGAVGQRPGAIIYAKTSDFLVKIIVWNYSLQGAVGR
ncbi:hypothetical protein TKK_0015601 [Trichogramma kaykai]